MLKIRRSCDHLLTWESPYLERWSLYWDGVLAISINGFDLVPRLVLMEYSGLSSRRVNQAFKGGESKTNVQTSGPWQPAWQPDGVQNVEGFDVGWGVVYWSGAEVTKPISFILLFFKFFNIGKIHVSYWISCSYLTGVAPAQLWGHLSNMNVMQRI